MNAVEMVTLFGLMVVLAALPSASVVLVVTRSATYGVMNGVAVSLGIILGDLVFILLAMLGLSVLAETMGGFFMIIKYIGAMYLVWLGFNLLLMKPEMAKLIDKKQINKNNLITSFLAGFFLTLGDIKAIVFYASLFPVFIDLTALKTVDVLTVVLLMLVSVGGVKILYALYSNKIADLAARHNFDKWVRKTAGGFMISVGGYLIVKS